MKFYVPVCFVLLMQFISHITSLIAWQCVKVSPSSTEDQVTVCRWLASFILVRAHPTHQTNSHNIHLPVCCVYAVLTVFSARTCPLHCLCLTHQLTDWLLQYQVPSVCWRHSAVCHSGRSQLSPDRQSSIWVYTCLPWDIGYCTTISSWIQTNLKCWS